MVNLWPLPSTSDLGSKCINVQLGHAQGREEEQGWVLGYRMGVKYPDKGKGRETEFLLPLSPVYKEAVPVDCLSLSL